MRRSATASAQKSRKSVASNLLESLPVPDSTQSIAKIVKIVGGGNLECRLPSPLPGDAGAAVLDQADTIMCRIPPKMKDLVFFRPGGFLIVTPEALAGEKARIKYSVAHALQEPQIKHLMGLGLWPAEFQSDLTPQSDRTENHAGDSYDADNIEDEDDIPRNTNRRPPQGYADSDSDESDSAESDDT